jgi:zinc protease
MATCAKPGARMRIRMDATTATVLQSKRTQAMNLEPINPAPRRRWAAAILILLLGPAAAGGALAAPPIQTWETPSGARVLFVAAPDLPMVDVRVVFDAGSARDGERPGLASLTAAMLDEGAGGFSADAIAERVEAVGAQLSTGAERDMAFASVRSLTESAALEVAVDTLTRILSEPSFDAAEFERVRQNRLVSLRLAEQNPGTVGQRALYRAVFGEHPYASDPSGTAESVSALTAADLAAFHQHFYTAPNATIAMVGALERPAAEALATRITAALPPGTAAPPVPPVPDLPAPSLERIPFPSSQTHVYVGQPGMRRDDPDYFPLYIGNHILGGGGLVSLLMAEVREKRGLSYSTYSYFVPMAERGPLLLGLQTRHSQADAARAVMLETLQRFIAAGPSAAELEAAIQNLTGSFPLRIASNASIVQYLAMIGFYGLPLDYLDRFIERVAAVIAEQIRDAFQRRVQPQRLAVVLVGGDDEPTPASAAPAADPDIGSSASPSRGSSQGSSSGGAAGTPAVSGAG